MDINLERYHKSIVAITKSETNTFLKKWERFNFNIAYKLLSKENEWYNHHRVIMWFVKIPTRIHSWLCYGFMYIKDDRVKGGRTWNDNYHMFSKLCRYKTWPDVKVTRWDRIRFRLITGYKFEY